MNKNISPANKKYLPLALTISIALLYIGVGSLFYLCKKMSDANDNAIKTQIAESKKIYVYNLEEVLRKINAIETKKQFEDEIIKLNDDLLEAEKNIKSLKDAKVKESFSSMYLNNLRMRRDELVDKYEKNIEELTAKINDALSSIAKERNIPVIFVQNAIALNTNFVVDLTDEIVARVQK